MKAVNAIIIALFAALAFSTFMLASKLFPNAVTNVKDAVKEAAEKQKAPEPTARPQPDQQINKAAVSASQTPAVSKTEPVQMPQPPAPAPPVKEEPKLRPVRDIKVVMYMTDW